MTGFVHSCMIRQNPLISIGYNQIKANQNTVFHRDQSLLFILFINGQHKLVGFSTVYIANDTNMLLVKEEIVLKYQ